MLDPQEDKILIIYPPPEEETRKFLQKTEDPDDCVDFDEEVPCNGIQIFG